MTTMMIMIMIIIIIIIIIIVIIKIGGSCPCLALRSCAEPAAQQEPAEQVLTIADYAAAAPRYGPIASLTNSWVRSIGC